MGENNNNQSEMYGARQCGDAVPPFFLESAEQQQKLQFLFLDARTAHRSINS